MVMMRLIDNDDDGHDHVDDTIDLIGPVDFDRKRLFEVLERRT